MNQVIDTSVVGLTKAFSYGILVPLFAYTGISYELVIILTVLIGMDCVTALIREVIVGNQVTSRTLWVGFTAKTLLIIVPFVLILVGKGANIDMSPIAKLVLSTFIIAEGYSILGNIVQIRNKDETLSEQDAITYVLRKAQAIIKNLLDRLMSTTP